MYHFSPGLIVYYLQYIYLELLITLTYTFFKFQTEFSFFDPNDTSCQEILFDPKTSVSELFAILRQWVPQVQQNIDIIGNEVRNSYILSFALWIVNHLDSCPPLPSQSDWKRRC